MTTNENHSAKLEEKTALIAGGSSGIGLATAKRFMKGLLMRQLQLVAHGEPSDVIELNTVPEPALGEEDVLISMEAAPINPSDFLYVRGLYGVRPAFPSSVGAEGIGRVVKIGSKVDVALKGK